MQSIHGKSSPSLIHGTKAQRHFAMRDDVACTVHWPICYKHLPEDVNDLCDWITRRARWLRAAARKAHGLPLETNLPDDISTPNDPVSIAAVPYLPKHQIEMAYVQESHEAYPFSTVTYHDDKHSKSAATESPYPLPKACTARLLLLTSENWAQVSAGYSTDDDTKYYNITLAETYAALSGQPLSKLICNRVASWKESKRILMLQTAIMPAPMMVTPMSHLIIESHNDDADEDVLENMTHQYILVVPDKVPVKLSPLDDVHDQSESMGHYLDLDMRKTRNAAGA